MGGKDDANGFSSNLGCDAPADRVLRHQPHRPPRTPLRRGPTHHRNYRRTLRTVEGRLGLAARLVGQTGLQTARDIALADARYFSRKCAHSFRSRAHRQSLIKELEHPDPTPCAGRQRLALALHRRELGAVLLPQFQASETLRSFHPLLRSEVDPGIKPQRDHQASVEGLGAMRDLDRLAAAALRETARRKKKLVERDVMARVIEADTRERDR